MPPPLTLYLVQRLGAAHLGITTFLLFLWQFFRRNYSILIAWLFGIVSLIMAFYFIVTGGIQETGHLWIYILPIVGTMVVPLLYSIIYNSLLIAPLVIILNSPIYSFIPAEYNSYFRVIFPISMLILTLCNYVAEYARRRTQKQLQAATEKLRNSAFTNPLTGAYNRRALTSHFGEQTESAYGLSFAMLDLDHFKKVNDTYGHKTGDKLLCHLVSLVNQCMPSGSYLYRWGGEEFLLVLKSNEYGILSKVLNDIRALVAQTPLEFESADHKFVTLTTTVSIGGLCALPGDDITSCINSADEYMYKAKQDGRNKVALSKN